MTREIKDSPPTSYEALLRHFSAILARFERKKAAALLCRPQTIIDPYFNEAATLNDQRAELNALMPHLAERRNREYEEAIVELAARALRELELDEVSP